MAERAVFAYPVYWEGEDTFVQNDHMDKAADAFCDPAEALRRKLKRIPDENTYLIERLRKDEGIMVDTFDAISFLLA
jgi:hypothetical protein